MISRRNIREQGLACVTAVGNHMWNSVDNFTEFSAIDSVRIFVCGPVWDSVKDYVCSSIDQTLQQYDFRNN